jgi:hypothetical protein
MPHFNLLIDIDQKSREMGLFFSGLSGLFGNFMNGEPVKILMLGLDAAGMSNEHYTVES